MQHLKQIFLVVKSFCFFASTTAFMTGPLLSNQSALAQLAITIEAYKDLT